MGRDPYELEKLLGRLKACFPAHAPLLLRESADAWSKLEDRFPGGHAERWFDAHDGDAAGRLVYEGFALLSVKQSLEARRSFSSLRRQSGLVWKPHWMLIAVAQGGRALAINDRTGALIALSPERSKAAKLAPSPEAWLRRIVEACEAKAMVWEPTVGLTNARVLHEHKQALVARAAQDNQALRYVAGIIVGIVFASAFLRMCLGR